MTQDNDPDIDYDAWPAPPAPDVTDAVVAGARLPVGTATEVVGVKRSARTLLLAGGAIALSVAVIVIAVVIDRSKQPPPAPTIADLRIEQLEQQVDELEAAIEKLNAIGATLPEPEPAPAPEPVTVEPEEAPVAQKDKPAAKPCDYAKLYEQGKAHYGKAQWGAALATFEQALDCKATDEAVTLAAMSACKARRATEAKHHFARVPESRRAMVQQVCLHQGIELVPAEDPPPACDWQALQDTGTDAYKKSQWSAALTWFEQAYDCQAAPETALFAVLSACKSARAVDARRWYKLTAEDKRANVQQTCLQKGINLE